MPISSLPSGRKRQERSWGWLAGSALRGIGENGEVAHQSVAAPRRARFRIRPARFAGLPAAPDSRQAPASRRAVRREDDRALVAAAAIGGCDSGSWIMLITRPSAPMR